MRARHLSIAFLLVAACSNEPGDTGPRDGEDTLDFPFDGNGGKEDVFGRSLVGVPDPYAADVSLAQREDELRTNMRLRRELGWETAYKVLEPVPLLGLADQIDARPDCPDSVEPNDLGQCARQRSQDACEAFESGGVEVCAWDGAACDATCDLLRLPDGQEVPTVPRFSSWYGVDDITRIFRHAYGSLTPEQRVERAALSDLQIGEALAEAHNAIERSNRWPLQRYTDAVGDLFDCPFDQLDGESADDYAARCIAARQSQFSGGAHSGGGIARLVYSPAMVLHLLRNYAEVLDCRDDTLADTWCGEGEPCVDPPEENFSRCFRAEFPVDGANPFAELAADDNRLGSLRDTGGTVVIKATWARVGFGFDLPVYDTDAASLLDRIGPGKLALWPEEGDRQIPAPEDLDELEFPGPDDIYTIKTRSGSLYRLTGLHIMTKELRHWVWVSLWWSDEPDEDFGADRPDKFAELPSYWSNYKMCVVTDYIEGDADPSGRFTDFPSLQAALEATGGGGAPTWCSNPYIERAAGNARTNCIGCHQHAGTRIAEDSTSVAFDVDDVIGNESANLSSTNRFPANGRLRRRTHFATDYSWAFSRLDDLTELVRTEVEFAGARDPQWNRINTILAGNGDATAGEEVFRNTSAERRCVDCHGDQGQGGLGPAFEQVFAQKTAWQALNTVINGRGSMPAWGERLTDQQLTDLFTYLTTTYDTP